MHRTKTPYSLLIRLTLAFSLVAVLVFSLVGGLLYHSLSITLRRRDDVEISIALDRFLQRSRQFGSTQSLVQHSEVFHNALLSHPAVYLAIFDKDGAILVQHSGQPGRHLTSSGPGANVQKAAYTCDPPTLGAARCVLGEETLPSGEPVHILLAHVAAERQSILAEYQAYIWLGLAAGSILMGALGYAIARRGLLPVKAIGYHTSRIEAHNLSERLDISTGPLELHELAISFNRMLDRLERAFSRLSQFSSDLAHDIRTPLANIISSSQVTLGLPRTVDEYETLIESNIEECERLQRMVENMLFLARADNSKQYLKLSKLDCRAEFAKLISYFDAVAEAKDVQFVIAGAAEVLADQTMFRRAVSNLISNALDHAEAGSDIGLHVDAAAEYVTVDVQNKGQPIPVEHIDKIFDRFYRVDASRQGSAKNTGLGLAIVKSIMESHRGKVSVLCREGNTIFTLHFPLAPYAH